MKRWIASVLLVSSILCGWWVMALAASESLSSKDRVEVFETVWKTIKDDYYDPSFNGVDWAAVRERYRPRVEAAKTDGQFYSLIKQMLRELHDLHTGFNAPDNQPQNNGLSVKLVEGKVVVVRVEPDSEEARAGVQAGMILLAVDAKSAEERTTQLRAALGHSSSAQADQFIIYGSFLTGQISEPLRLRLERVDGTQFDAVLRRHAGSRPPPILISRRLPSDFHYLKINTLRSPVAEQFKSEFASFKDAPGLIIDLRGNNGGDIHDVGLKIAGYFFSTKVSFGRFVNRSGETPPFRKLSTGGGSQIYEGPVVILVDEGTRSAGEVFANGYQENGRATIVGEQSCGCVLDSESKSLNGGGVLQYSHLGERRSDAAPFE